ncbi:MAG: hypothetical protein ACXWQR_12550, partial [Ktedonobacterales bacterium]
HLSSASFSSAVDGQPPGEAAVRRVRRHRRPRWIFHGAPRQFRRAHPAFLPICRYHDIPQLRAVLDEAVVQPVELFVGPRPLFAHPSSSIAAADGTHQGSI